MPEGRHVFSMSVKVTGCNNDFSDAGKLASAIAWWKSNGIEKVWLESYRHGERVSNQRLGQLRERLVAAGFETCGMITPTMLNNPERGAKEAQMVVCWSDEVAQRRLREEVVRAVGFFDTVIIDDFMFSICDDRCKRCSADKKARGIASWPEYKRTLLAKVCERDLIGAARGANPRARLIIKYPCWWRNYARAGYDPVRQTDLFGSCWIGTETRDANPDPLQACWIVAWIDELTGGKCGGGWYDALDCTPQKFVEQAYYTILGGAKESLIHCYDYILAKDPGRTPFGEKARCSDDARKALSEAMPRLRRLADFLRGSRRGKFKMGSNGVSEHLFTKEGKVWRARLNTSKRKVDGLEPGAFELKEFDAGADRF